MELKSENLAKAYGNLLALQNVNLDLKPGIIAVVGPNGSGKTTLLRCLASLLPSDRGQLWFDGLNYGKNLGIVRAQMGYLPQDLDLPAHLTPRQLLTYLATLKNISDEGEVDSLLRSLGLEKIAELPFFRLSGGQIRLVGIAQAFLGQPTLLLLDELDHGLDVEERSRVLGLMRDRVPGRLILFSTHDLSFAESVADSVIILHEGQVLFSGGIGDLYQNVYASEYSIEKPATDCGRETSREVHSPDFKPGRTQRQLTLEEMYLCLLQEPFGVSKT
jgi:ABC-2 type transport system ATP-binding protein